MTNAEHIARYEARLNIEAASYLIVDSFTGRIMNTYIVNTTPGAPATDTDYGYSYERHAREAADAMNEYEVVCMAEEAGIMRAEAAMNR